MQKVATLPTDKALAAFGSVWLAEDMGRRLCQHLGAAKPILHFGDAFRTLEEAQAARPDGYAVVPLGPTVALPNITPVPRPRHQQSGPSIPHEVFIFEFDELLEKGLRVVPAQINRVEFDYPPTHMMGNADFVASAIVAGENDEYRVTFEYDAGYGIRIVENPQIATERGYTESRQRMAFFRQEDAEFEADRFSETLVRAANWRERAAA